MFSQEVLPSRCFGHLESKSTFYTVLCDRIYREVCYANKSELN